MACTNFLWRHLLFYGTIFLSVSHSPAQGVKIAAYNSLTGSQSKDSVAVQGWTFWAKYVNDTFGGVLVGGKREPIELVTWDDESNRTKNSILFQQFADEGYKFVIGGHTSTADLAGEFFQQQKMMVIMCCTGPDSYYAGGNPYLFGIHRSSLDYPKAFLQSMVLQQKKHVVIIYNDATGFTTSTADSAEKFALNIGLNVTTTVHFEGAGYVRGTGIGYEQLRQIVKQLKETAEPDTAYVFCTLSNDGEDAATLIDEFQIDTAGTWVSVAPTAMQYVENIGAKAAEFSFSPTQWHPSLEFVDRFFGTSANYANEFRKVYGYTPDYTMASGTAAALALGLAMESANTTESEAVIQAMRELRTDSFYGPMAFNRYQRNYGGSTATIEIINSEQASVFPTIGAQSVPRYPPSQSLRGQCVDAITADQFAACEAELQKVGVNVVAIVLPVVGVSLLILVAIGYLYHQNTKKQRDNSKAPKSSNKPFAVMFTDIQSSTTLWAEGAVQMADILDVHHSQIRALIKKHKCYEVKTIGDCFMVASECASQIFQLGLELQIVLYQTEWGPGLDMMEGVYASTIDPAYQGEAATRMNHWNGLRVRCGLHYGTGTAVYDSVVKGYDYYGTVVNMASRVEGVCHGGQLALTQAFLDALPPALIQKASWLELGEVHLRGLSEPVTLHQAVPTSLAGRRFPPLRIDTSKEQDTTDVESVAASETKSHITGSVDHEHALARHALVRSGTATVEQVRMHYESNRNCIRLLLQSIPISQRKAYLQTLCNRLKVKYTSHHGPGLEGTIHAMAMRTFPSSVTHGMRTATPQQPSLLKPDARVCQQPRSIRQPEDMPLSATPGPPGRTVTGNWIDEAVQII